MLSLVLSTALVAFFLLYTSPFPTPAPVQPFAPTPEGAPGHLEAEVPVIAGLGGYLVTTLVFTVPPLLMWRSQGRPVRAGVTLLVGAVAWLSVAVVDLPGIAVAGAVGATVGAIIADVVLAQTVRVRADRPRWWLPVVAGCVAMLVWTGQLAGLGIADALRWPVSLCVGVVVLAGFAASAAGFLAALES